MVDQLEPFDASLRIFAKQLNAKLMKDGVILINPRDKESFHTRKIIWLDGPIGKAVIIEPYYDRNGITSLWNFSNIAWLEDGQPERKPMWEVYLFKGVELKIIFKNINELLAKSETNLKKITAEDLK